jgi:hypothetical protein
MRTALILLSLAIAGCVSARSLGRLTKCERYIATTGVSVHKLTFSAAEPRYETPPRPLAAGTEVIELSSRSPMVEAIVRARHPDAQIALRAHGAPPPPAGPVTACHPRP